MNERAPLDTTSEEWLARATIYELLSMGFLVPKKFLGETLVSGEYACALHDALTICGTPMCDYLDQLEQYRHADAQVAFHEIRREYTRLFIGERNPLITPYVGIWTAQQRGEPGMLFASKETMEIERFMRRCGAAKNVESGQANDPLDHIGTLCEFLEYLCLVQAKAVEPAPSAVVREEDYGIFLKAYVKGYRRWLIDRVRQQSTCAFYRTLADVWEDVISIAREPRRNDLISA